MEIVKLNIQSEKVNVIKKGEPRWREIPLWEENVAAVASPAYLGTGRIFEIQMTKRKRATETLCLAI